jgi:cobalt-zinc-cadmium efflux system outer membrane protein
MTANATRSGLLWPATVACLCGLLTLAGGVGAEPEEGPKTLTLEGAVRYALENNPALAAQRQQRGIAAARVIIAETYPYNPLLENRVQGAEGPKSAAITNRTPLEHLIVWPVELFHQGRYRREGAAATLSRTDWEIAYQEQTLAVQVIRAYVTALYRSKKLDLLDETVRFNQRLVEDVDQQVRNGTRPAADQFVVESELIDIVNSLNGTDGRRTLLVAARNDLARALGVVGLAFEIEGALEPPPMTWDAAALPALAEARRADLQARREAVNEAAANVRLTVANRWGNPSVGPVYTIDPTGVNTFGVQLNVPLPFCNTHRGDIRLAEEQQAQAALLLRQAEVNVRQDVAAALARLAEAEKRAEVLRSKSLPDLEQGVKNMRKLFDDKQPGADLPRLIDLHRKLLRARDIYLDALWAVRQARADLLAATGEPVLELRSPPPEPQP